jgi:hypothetical protein
MNLSGAVDALQRFRRPALVAVGGIGLVFARSDRLALKVPLGFDLRLNNRPRCL